MRTPTYQFTVDGGKFAPKSFDLRWSTKKRVAELMRRELKNMGRRVSKIRKINVELPEETK